MRAGLRSLLANADEIRFVDDLTIENEEADVVITSASPASFLDRARAEAISGAILFLRDAPPNVQTMKRLSQVWGILPLDSSLEEVIAAIRALSQGLIVGARQLMFASEGEAAQSPLTEREAEVLDMLAKGLANKQIASALGISEHTVKFHVSSIYTKLNVSNRTEAVREGLRGGWVTL
jgi:DNA-binding NarL/FixJ family response regulator